MTLLWTIWDQGGLKGSLLKSNFDRCVSIDLLLPHHPPTTHPPSPFPSFLRGYPPPRPTWTRPQIPHLRKLPPRKNYPLVSAQMQATEHTFDPTTRKTDSGGVKHLMHCANLKGQGADFGLHTHMQNTNTRTLCSETIHQVSHKPKRLIWNTNIEFKLHNLVYMLQNSLKQTHTETQCQEERMLWNQSFGMPGFKSHPGVVSNITMREQTTLLEEWPGPTKHTLHCGKPALLVLLPLFLFC